MIDLWKDNQVSEHYQIDVYDLTTQFLKWDAVHGDISHYQPLERTIRQFITSTEGKQSVFDEQQFPEIYDAIKTAWRKTL